MNSSLRNVLFWSCVVNCIPQIFISFGVQYSEVYMLSHINTQQKAITTVIANVCGVLSYYILSMDIVLKFINKHVKIFLLMEMISFNIAHWIIPDYPWYAMIGLTLSNHLVAKINEVIFEDLHNGIFKGRNRTILSTKRKMWKMVGMVSGSGLTLLVMELTISQVVYIALMGDLMLMLMNLILYRKLKR